MTPLSYLTQRACNYAAGEDHKDKANKKEISFSFQSAPDWTALALAVSIHALGSRDPISINETDTEPEARKTRWGKKRTSYVKWTKFICTEQSSELIQSCPWKTLEKLRAYARDLFNLMSMSLTPAARASSDISSRVFTETLYSARRHQIRLLYSYWHSYESQSVVIYFLFHEEQRKPGRLGKHVLNCIYKEQHLANKVQEEHNYKKIICYKTFQYFMTFQPGN